MGGTPRTRDCRRPDHGPHEPLDEEGLAEASVRLFLEGDCILAALGRSLLKDFPNPDRIGCPGPEVLKRISSHEMNLSEAEKWLDHLTSCSPCYRDFSQFQTAYRSRRTRTLVAIAATILLV